MRKSLGTLCIEEAGCGLTRIEGQQLEGELIPKVSDNPLAMQTMICVVIFVYVLIHPSDFYCRYALFQQIRLGRDKLRREQNYWIATALERSIAVKMILQSALLSKWALFSLVPALLPCMAFLFYLISPTSWFQSEVWPSVGDGATSYLLSHVSTRWSRNDVDVT